MWTHSPFVAGWLINMTLPKEQTFFFTTSICFLAQDSAEDKISICVVGNKVDLREQHPEGTCVSSLHGEKLAKVSNSLTPTAAEKLTQTPPTFGCQNKTEDVHHAPADVRSPVLRDQRQRWNQRRRGRSSSGQVGGREGLELQVVFGHITEACFSFHV